MNRKEGETREMKTTGAEKKIWDVRFIVSFFFFFLAMIDVEEVKTKQKQEDQWSFDGGQNTKQMYLLTCSTIYPSRLFWC